MPQLLAPIKASSAPEAGSGEQAQRLPPRSGPEGSLLRTKLECALESEPFCLRVLSEAPSWGLEQHVVLQGRVAIRPYGPTHARGWGGSPQVAWSRFRTKPECPLESERFCLRVFIRSPVRGLRFHVILQRRTAMRPTNPARLPLRRLAAGPMEQVQNKAGMRLRINTKMLRVLSEALIERRPEPQAAAKPPACDKPECYFDSGRWVTTVISCTRIGTWPRAGEGHLDPRPRRRVSLTTCRPVGKKVRCLERRSLFQGEPRRPPF